MERRLGFSKRVAAAIVLAVLATFLSAGPAQAAGTATITGVITSADPEWDRQVVVKVKLFAGPLITVAVVDPDTGGFTASLPSGAYQVFFEYVGSANLLSRFHSNGSYLTFAADATVDVSTELTTAASVSGSATGVDGPLESFSVRVFQGGTALQTARVEVDAASGTYRIDRLHPGDIKIVIHAGPRYKPRCWNENRSSCTLSLRVQTSHVSVPQTVLPLASSITGTVTGHHAGESLVYLYRAGVQYWTAPLAADGSYEFIDMGPGTFTVQVRSGAAQPSHLPAWWGGTSSETATPIVLADGELRTGIDLVLPQTSSISGTVSELRGELWLLSRYSEVVLLREQGTGPQRFTTVKKVYTATDGSFSFTKLMPGNYIIRVNPPAGIGLGTKYWPDARYVYDAGVISVTSDQSLVADVDLDGAYIDLFRITGKDRFGTVVQASQFTFPEDDPVVPVVYIANALNYPDALAAGPAAVVQGGTLLTVAPDEIPLIVLTELRRLDPQRIVVVGGPTMVSERVLAQLRAEFPGESRVDRIAGANRYETSRLIARDAFVPGSFPMIYVATGNNYPDALAAGPVAGHQGAPVILVNGYLPTADAATVELIRYFNPTWTMVLGGPPSVSDGFVNSLYFDYGISASRTAGENRYETAWLLNKNSFIDSEFAFVATGNGFADALGGGVLAGNLGAPLYLGVQNCFLPYVAEDMIENNVRGIGLIGGPNMLSDAVLRGELC